MASSTQLPSHLFDSYKRYKLQTARLASWLGTTSQSLGYVFAATPPPKDPTPAAAKRATPTPSSTTPGNPPASGGGRAKGKARKAAKAAAAAPAPSPPPASASEADSQSAATLPTTIMTTRDFITLAQFICDKEPPVTVPARVIDWACRAIQSRRLCAEWFHAATSTGDAAKDEHAATVEKNQTHTHFIGVLEQVVSILAPRVGIGAQASSPAGAVEQEKPMSGVELLESRFAALAMDDSTSGTGEGDDDDEGDEDSEWAAVFAMVQETLTGKKKQGAKAKGKGGKAKKPAKPLTPSAPRRKYQVKYEDEEEMVFAYLDFLRELESVRAYVKALWSQYARAEIKLEVASATTTAAVDKVQEKLDALFATYPSLARNNAKYARMVFERLCALRNQPATLASASTRKQDDNLVHADVWDLAEFTYLSMAEVLEQTREQIVASSRPKVYRFPTATPEMRTNWSQGTKIAGWSAELTQAYRSWKRVEERQIPLPVSDHLFTQLSALAQHPTKASGKATAVPLFTLFVAKVFCDINDTLAHRLPEAQHDMHKAWYPHKYGLVDFMTYLPHRPSPLYAHHIELWGKEQDATVLLWLRGQVNGTTSTEVDAPELFAQHPWLAGMVLLYAHLSMRYFAMCNADMWGCVLFSAHMYEAGKMARTGGNNKPWWGLMEQLIQLVKKETIFYGKVPKDLNDAWYAINLAFGVSGYELNAWQRGRQTYSRNWKRSDRDPVCVEDVLDEASPLGMALFQRMFDGGTPVQLATRMEQIMLKDLNDAAAAAALTSRSTAQVKTRKSMAFFEYLDGVRTHLMRELPLVAFNLTELHVQSLRLMLHLRKRMTPHLMRSGIDMSTVTIRDDQLPLVAWHVVMGVGAGIAHLAMSQVRDPQRAVQVAKDMLVEAKNMVAEMEDDRVEFETSGHHEYDEMLEEEIQSEWADEHFAVMEYFRRIKKQYPDRKPGGIPKLFKFKLGRRVAQMEE